MKLLDGNKHKLNEVLKIRKHDRMSALRRATAACSLLEFLECALRRGHVRTKEISRFFTRSLAQNLSK